MRYCEVCTKGPRCRRQQLHGGRPDHTSPAAHSRQMVAEPRPRLDLILHQRTILHQPVAARATAMTSHPDNRPLNHHRPWAARPWAANRLAPRPLPSVDGAASAFGALSTLRPSSCVQPGRRQQGGGLLGRRLWVNRPKDYATSTKHMLGLATDGGRRLCLAEEHGVADAPATTVPTEQPRSRNARQTPITEHETQKSISDEG